MQDDEGEVEPVASPVAEREVVLAPVPASVRQARQAVTDALRDAGRDDLIDTATLAVSELVTNAVIHAGSLTGLRVRASSNALVVEVSDDDDTPPRRRRHLTESATGRGLELVAAVTTLYGVRSNHDGGKVVWFVIGDLRGSDARHPADDGPVGVDSRPGTVVELRGVPGLLWLAALDHWGAVLRELYLYCAERPDALADLDLPAAGRAVRLFETAQGEHLADTSPVVPAQPADLTLRVRDDDGQCFIALQDALDRGVSLGRDSVLLTRPALPEVVALRDWACSQVVSQLAGVSPHLYTGPVTIGGPAAVRTEVPDLPAPTAREPHPPRDAHVGWAVVAADETNRFVAVDAVAEELLHRSAESLIGQRLTVIIPPRLREQHIAGFTRLLTTGVSRVVGQELVLPVLRPDGSEVLCDVCIERHVAPDDGAFFVARMRPHQPPAD